MKALLFTIAGFLLLGFCACDEEEIEYVPIAKKHLGETYETYTLNNVIGLDSVGIVVLNFYPEEVTDLSYMQYSESACAFTFHRGETADYRISWDYDAGESYVEVQYGQNAMWYTINEQQYKGEYLLRANDGMAVRIVIRASGRGVYDEEGNVEYLAGITVNDFRIEEAE